MGSGGQGLGQRDSSQQFSVILTLHGFCFILLSKPTGTLGRIPCLHRVSEQHHNVTMRMSHLTHTLHHRSFPDVDRPPPPHHR
jgi:hypothetical protein